MSKTVRYLNLAGDVGEMKKDRRAFYLGAVGVRSDGVIVASYNAPSKDPEPHAHAEARLVRKLDKFSTVYVARITKGTKKWALAKPCEDCMRALIRAHVCKIFYTICVDEYGVIYL